MALSLRAARALPDGPVAALPYPRRVPSLRDATAESPAPVRAVANAVAQWIDRLGGVWVEGQIAQVNRRPGMQTVFMTLRDTVADISVTLTCARSLVDSMNPPLVEGASGTSTFLLFLPEGVGTVAFSDPAGLTRVSLGGPGRLDDVVTGVAPVPLPPSGAALVLAVVGLLALRRRAA